MLLQTLILYPEEAREVAAETVARLLAAPQNDGYARPAMLPDGTLLLSVVRPVQGLLSLRDDSVLGGPRLHNVAPDPIRWVSHAVEAAADVMGHLLLRRDGWAPEELAAAGLGIVRRDTVGGWTDEGRAVVRRWLFDPRRDEAEVLTVLKYAADTGLWCLYSDESPEQT